jgi:hypothetical protein
MVETGFLTLYMIVATGPELQALDPSKRLRIAFVKKGGGRQ